ncbi:MAG: O-antigen ligase family protein [Acidimicrobiia bacterium]|nr:O-antigen ligase family protein [Acidimicrobiia bacterium]
MTPSRSPVALAAAALAFLLPVLYSPSVEGASWTARAALVLFLIAIGLPRIVPLFRTSARAASIAAVAFLALAGISTLLADRPALSLYGPYNWGIGLLFIAALVAAWALGTGLSSDDLPLLEQALVAGVCVNAVVALVQGGVALDVVPFTRYEGRAAGLLGNPVHLGTLCAAGLVLLVPRIQSAPMRWAPVGALVAAAVELSGSRFALGLAIVIALVALFRTKGLAGVTAAAAIGLGLVLGVGIGVAGGATTGAGRIQSGGGSGGVTARLHAWASAGRAVADHPVLGAGPGRFSAATSKYRDLALVRSEGPDVRYVEAHNFVVEYLTTTGVLGLAALATWLALAARRARGPLLWFAAVVLAMHLVEPQFVATTPLAALALGAAGRVGPVGGGRNVLLATSVLTLAAAVGAGRLLYGDYELHQAGLDFHLAPARTAVRVLPPWSDPPQVAAKIALYQSIATNSHAGRAEALRESRLATERDPADPIAWSALGEIQLYYGDPASAMASFRRALLVDPWSVRALSGVANVATTLGDRPTARRALARAVQANPSDPKLRRRLAAA